jgi:hypothetical protein
MSFLSCGRTESRSDPRQRRVAPVIRIWVHEERLRMGRFQPR